MGGHYMPIGHDIDLLCDAVTFAASGYTINQRNLQRRVRVGHLKAQRLLFLMDDYGITDGPPLTRWSSRTVLITKEQLPTALARLREIAGAEVTSPPGA